MPIPALIVAPPLCIKVIVFTALKIGFSVALPIVKPPGGAVSEPERVSIIGPDIPVTAFKSASAKASDE